MPIRPELRWFYPIDWPILSRVIRFERARGRCERCGRPHGQRVRQTRDGRWLDSLQSAWRDDEGKDAPWPDMLDYMVSTEKAVILAACHLDHDPANSRGRNLLAMCQRCHLRHDRAEHRRRRQMRRRRRFALGDLFEGVYSTADPF